MKTNFKTYLTILGVLVALLLIYTSSIANYATPKFTYSIKDTTRSVTTHVSGRVSAGMVEMLSQ